MDTPITLLAREKAQSFRRNFTKLSKELFTYTGTGNNYHSAEYGGYRERLLKHLLAAFMPGYLSLAEGFLINSDGSKSTQADIIIYDNIETPKIEGDDLRRFFPTETICGVGEVKSNISISALKQALEKLCCIKAMRLKKPSILIPSRPVWRTQEVTLAQLVANQEGYENKTDLLKDLYDPIEHHWQNLVTFLVCSRIETNKKSFESVVTEIIREPSSEQDAALRHNMLLSLEDGYQSYASRGLPVAYPRLYNEILGVCARTGIRTVTANDNCDHIIAFVADLCGAVGDTAVYPFNVADHFGINSQFHFGS